MVILLVDKMASFLNGPILPMVAAIGGMVYFGKTYYIANKIANKNRKEENLKKQKQKQRKKTEMNWFKEDMEKVSNISYKIC